VQGSLFDNVSPFRVAVFDDHTSIPTKPILRLVFALASDKSVVIVRHSPSRINKRTSSSKFTAYDIWCAGATHKTFKVIGTNEDNAYSELLLRSMTLFDAYTIGGRDQNATQTSRVLTCCAMHPAVDEEDVHYESYMTLNDSGHNQKNAKTRVPVGLSGSTGAHSGID
jgi:hypothetical protein